MDQMASSSLDENTSSWNRINRRGGSFLLIACLFGCFAFAKLMANTKLGLRLALVDDRTIGEIRLIRLVQEHPWVICLYFGSLVAVWLWLALRSAPRASTLVCLVLLSLPCLFYIRACLHIGTKLLELLPA